MQSFSTSDRFDALDAKDRDRLDSISKLDRYAKDDEIASLEQPWLYLITHGRVELRARVRAGEMLLAVLGPGDIFGELESFSHVAGLRYVATEEVTCWSLAKNPLMQEMRLHRSLAAGMLLVYSRSISEKLRAANEALTRMPKESLEASALSRPPPPPPPVRRMPSSSGKSKPEEAPRPNGPLGRPAHLSGEEAGWLSVLGAERKIAAGETVVREGDTGRSFFVVGQGKLEVMKRVEGRANGGPSEERPLAELADGDLFGFMSFVDKRPRSASVVARTDCTVEEIESDALEKALRLNFTVSFKFLGTLCGVLGRTFRDTAERVMLG